MVKKELTETQKLKLKKWTFKVLDLIFSYFIPVIVISLKYDLFSKAQASYKLTGLGIIIVLILFVKFWKNITNAIKEVKRPIIRQMFYILKNFIIVVVICFILNATKSNVDNLITIVVICGISISVGIVFREYFNEMKKAEQKDERQNEMVEAILKAKSLDK